MTGNSVIGDIRSDVRAIRADMHQSLSTIQTALSQVSPAIHSALSSAGGSALLSEGAGPAFDPHSSQEFQSVQQQLSIIHQELIGVKRRLDRDDSITFSSGPCEAHPRRCVPVFYLSNSFKLPSCDPFTLLTRWVTPEPPAPAWRYIRNEMLPRGDGRRAQECLLSIYKEFMLAFLGRHPNLTVVESNIQACFGFAWARMASTCEWSSSRTANRSVKTVYGWLRDRPVAMKTLQDTPLKFPEVFEVQLAMQDRNSRELTRLPIANVGHHYTPPYTTSMYHHTPPDHVAGGA